MKILTIVGARPQFIKAAMLSKEILKYNETSLKGLRICEEIIHTGQHYDKIMSDVFFTQLKIPKPVRVLKAGGLGHGAMTGLILIEIEKEIIKRKPDFLLVYGDTNSTLAGALAAVKLHVPIIHIEAGLRSFNKNMPEEINRIVTDHSSSLLFCPTKLAVENLRNENINDGVVMVGDIMFDAALFFGNNIENSTNIVNILNIKPQQFILSTLHRAENTDNKQRLKDILLALIKIANADQPIVLPLHPRTGLFIKKYGLDKIVNSNKYLKIIDPVSFFEMIALEKNAKLIITDSGGVQKEAYFHKVPCITLRDETEWIETVEKGWNQLVGTYENKIINAISKAKKGTYIEDYGKGDTANRILMHLLQYLNNKENKL